MRINLRKFFVVSIITFLTAIFANSVQAQWTLLSSKNDSEGKEYFREERHDNGSIRTMTRIYYPKTRIKKSEIVITRFKDGSRNRIEERRDEQNRITFLMNEFKNTKGEKIRGIQQWWSYENKSDQQGTQKNFKYNPKTDSWIKL